MNIAIIPARGGSKRIPRKNIKDFFGRPMIAYAIEAARKSILFDRIIVSTDDEEIAEIAVKYGADAPFRRSAQLSDDFVPTVPVVADAINQCEVLGWKIENACCIYPAVPFLRPTDLVQSFNLWIKSGKHYCFPILEFPAAPQRALKISADKGLSPFYPDFELTRTQDLEAAYFDAGQFYWGSTVSWKSIINLHSNASGYLMPSSSLVDIDTPEDWTRAELIYQVLERG
ncbi:pseudaminic acid cytidylyltransferase [Polynucleobacter sp. AM-7D1]|uniref:pseudaminic acid cytidylyltransferase n=1 Tax=Polynucleobacter sp. AM-7D1 TaxID=2689102 RepID=UPI001BFE733A|nr:pseudaminic acid cytidylyltransferase [Polynucleobacter sp. AM-7D1]QWE28985.1 pseudaminic acid cytidylyltransferase [Polynucleobacter sp. AM-7D1]